MQVLVITRPAQFLCDAARNLEVLCPLLCTPFAPFSYTLIWETLTLVLPLLP